MFWTLKKLSLGPKRNKTLELFWKIDLAHRPIFSVWLYTIERKKMCNFSNAHCGQCPIGHNIWVLNFKYLSIFSSLDVRFDWAIFIINGRMQFKLGKTFRCSFLIKLKVAWHFFWLLKVSNNLTYSHTIRLANLIKDNTTRWICKSYIQIYTMSGFKKACSKYRYSKLRIIGNNNHIRANWKGSESVSE